MPSTSLSQQSPYGFWQKTVSSGNSVLVRASTLARFIEVELPILLLELLKPDQQATAIATANADVKIFFITKILG